MKSKRSAKEKRVVFKPLKIHHDKPLYPIRWSGLEIGIPKHG